jgi:hypothetical protein
MRFSMNRTLAFKVLTALLPSCVVLSGCSYSPGGAGVSNDVFTYPSSAHLPQTITVLDTRTDEQLLVVEIPVGQQLVLSFYNMNDEADGFGTLRWGVMPAGKPYGGLTNTMRVPPASARRVDVSVRRSPEYSRPLVQTPTGDLPKGVTIADAPSTKPAQSGSKPVEVEVTSPKAPKVDIPQ